MKVFPVSILKQIEKYTIENEPIKSIDLMERAASAIVFELMSRWKRNTPFVVFAGPGNNGGDALAVSRLLAEEGYKVSCYLFNTKGTLSSECAKNKERLIESSSATFHEITNDFTPPLLTENSVVVDGLFGVGLSEPLSGGFASLIQYINESVSTVVSIDIPSGLFADDNRNNQHRNIVQADLTLSIQLPKLSFFFADNYRYIGEWKVLDIGLHQDIINNTTSLIQYTMMDDVKKMLKRRPKFSHKGTYGHALIVGGSFGMMGAAVLAAKAVLRCGAGMVTLHTPKCGVVVSQTSLPEAILSVDNNIEFFTNMPSSIDYDAVGIGTGMGKAGESVEGFSALLSQQSKPCVIDADALNFLSTNRELLQKLPPHSIITPHPKEFIRLVGECDSSYDLLLKAIEFAKDFNIFVVLKGCNTVVVSPEGCCRFNSTGNTGMSTAGSGDVLAGIITSLLAQGYKPERAAVLGVFIHGLSADLSLKKQSEESLIASDIIDNIGKAFQLLKQ